MNTAPVKYIVTFVRVVNPVQRTLTVWAHGPEAARDQARMLAGSTIEITNVEQA